MTRDEKRRNLREQLTYFMDAIAALQKIKDHPRSEGYRPDDLDPVLVDLEKEVTYALDRILDLAEVKVASH